jgi:hypothetical protein
MAVQLSGRYLAILVIVRRVLGLRAVDSRSLRSDNYVRMEEYVRRSTSVPFRYSLGDVRRKFMQRPSLVLDGTLG